MIHPSYTELMKVVNTNVNGEEEPVVNSRYSIVIATSKRARQIIDGAHSDIYEATGEKPLSVAVEELNQGDIKILSDEDAALAAEAAEAALAFAEEVAITDEEIEA